MDIAFERNRIVEEVKQVDEEWLILALQRLLGLQEIREKRAAEIWGTQLAARNPAEMLAHIDEAEADILAGRTMNLDDYLKTIQ